MDEIENRLVICFQTVFPDLPESEVRVATRASVAMWDSIATVTLVNVIEDEFGIQMELDLLEEMDSFSRIHHFIRKE
jgi:acyl carrier protein